MPQREEFLNLLCHNPATANIPFLFMSDCDPHAISIYATLKFGSRNLAFASPSITCPQLQWIGLGFKQWEDYVSKYPERYAEHLRRQSPEMTDEQIAEHLGPVQDTVQYTLHAVKFRQRRRLNDAYMKRIRSLQQSKVLEGQSEVQVLTELENLESSVSKASPTN